MSLNVGREIQKLLFGKLNGDAGLDALVEGVFDHVPDQQAYPFVHIGEMEINPVNAVKQKNYDGQLQIDVWARPGAVGKAPVYDIMNEVRRILDGNRDWAITDWCMLFFSETFSTVVVEEDNVTYHGVMRFNFRLGGRSST